MFLKSTFKLKCAAAILTLVASTSAFAGAPTFTALDLAIQHFNADGTKQIKSWGPEHTMMYNALQAVAAKYPELAEATGVADVQKNDRFKALTLQLKGTPAQNQETMALVSNLADGCGYQRDTSTSVNDSGFVPVKTNTVVESTYDLSFNARSKKVCRNPEAASIANLGPNQLIVNVSDVYGQQSVAITLINSVNTWQDMRFVKSELLKVVSGRTKELVSRLNPLEPAQQFGTTSDITLVNSSGRASPGDKFTLKYYIGKGDCLAGCISKTYFTIEVTPLADGTFKIDRVN